MQSKAQVLDAAGIGRALARITHEIIERNRGVDGICLLGVRRRGEPLAAMLAANILRFEGRKVPLGYLDITCHRDDITKEEREGVVANSHIPCDVRDKTVILVDDVLYFCRSRISRSPAAACSTMKPASGYAPRKKLSERMEKSDRDARSSRKAKSTNSICSPPRMNGSRTKASYTTRKINILWEI